MICQRCGTEFKQSNTRGPKPKWCSGSCRMQVYRERQLDAEYARGYATGFAEGYDRGWEDRLGSPGDELKPLGAISRGQESWLG